MFWIRRTVFLRCTMVKEIPLRTSSRRAFHSRWMMCFVSGSVGNTPVAAIRGLCSCANLRNVVSDAVEIWSGTVVATHIEDKRKQKSDIAVCCKPRNASETPVHFSYSHHPPGVRCNSSMHLVFASFRPINLIYALSYLVPYTGLVNAVCSSERPWTDAASVVSPCRLSRQSESCLHASGKP